MKLNELKGGRYVMKSMEILTLITMQGLIMVQEFHVSIDKIFCSLQTSHDPEK